MGYHPHFAQTGLRYAPDKEAAYADVLTPLNIWELNVFLLNAFTE